MSYSAIGKFFNLSAKTIAALHIDGLIEMPPSEANIKGLALLSKVWGRDRYLKLQLSRHSKQKRRKLADCAELTRPESYAYNRFVMHRLDQCLAQKKRLTIADVVGEINWNYKVPVSNNLHQMVTRMRWRAYKTDLTDPVYADQVGKLVKKSELEKRRQIG